MAQPNPVFESILTWRPTSVEAHGIFTEVVDLVRLTLSASPLVTCCQALHGSKGWSLVAYVLPNALKVYRGHLFALAQQTLMLAADRTDTVFVLGYAGSPFSPMSLGFGAALAYMPDKATACWSSYAQGFC